MLLFRNDLLELLVLRTGPCGIPKHSHDEFVISANLQGHETVRLDGREFVVCPQDITAYNPGQLQSSDVTGPVTFISVHVQPRAMHAYLGDAHEFAQALHHRPDLATALQAMVTPGGTADHEESLIGWLSTLADGAPAQPRMPASGVRSAIVRRVQDMLMAHLESPPDLRTLALEADLTPSYLIRLFHREAGLPPKAWLMEQRLRLARRLLQSGGSLVDTALRCGFADQAHFSKCFHKVHGLPPGRYRQVNFRQDT